MKKLALVAVLVLCAMVASGLGGAHAADADETSVPKSLNPHDPIYINGNENFTAENGVVSGSGTESEPYVIEGWKIEASNANGIWITNTEEYFVIRNCYVYVPTTLANKYCGVYFYNVTHGKIENVTSQNNLFGIYIEGGSSGIKIVNCILNASHNTGIHITSSHNNMLLSNTVTNSKYAGINITENSNDTLIENCRLRKNSPKQGDNPGCGVIRVEGSSLVTILGSEIISNGATGVYIAKGASISKDVTIKSCNISSNLRGIYANGGTKVRIENCQVYDNYEWEGILIYDATFSEIEGCTVCNNTNGGVVLGDYEPVAYVMNSSLTKNGGRGDIGAVSGTVAELLNTTFDREACGNSIINISWYLRVRVINTTKTPIGGANIDIVNANAVQVFTCTSDQTGWCRNIPLQERMLQGATTTYFTPYTIIASARGVKNITTVNMDSTKETILTLSGANIKVSGSVPKPYLAGKEFNVTATIKNNEDAFDASGNLTVKFYKDDDPVPFSTRALGNLNVGEEITVVSNNTEFKDGGKHTIKVKVISDNANDGIDPPVLVLDQRIVIAPPAPVKSFELPSSFTFLMFLLIIVVTAFFKSRKEK